MNKRQNAGENCIYSMWILQRISLRRDIPRYQKQQFDMYYYIVFDMYYYIVVLKNVAKFTRTHLHRSLFSIWNLQLHWDRDIGTYMFLWSAHIGFCEFYENFFEHFYYGNPPAKWFWKEKITKNGKPTFLL